MNVQPFSPGSTSTLAVTTVTGRVALTGGGSVVEIQNTGTAVMFVKIGSSTVVAAVTDYPVQPGHSKMVSRGPSSLDTHIAAITGTGTATLYATVGDGI